jgi:hypothetical protein
VPKQAPLRFFLCAAEWKNRKASNKRHEYRVIFHAKKSDKSDAPYWEIYLSLLQGKDILLAAERNAQGVDNPVNRVFVPCYIGIDHYFPFLSSVARRIDFCLI